MVLLIFVAVRDSSPDDTGLRSNQTAGICIFFDIIIVVVQKAWYQPSLGSVFTLRGLARLRQPSFVSSALYQPESAVSAWSKCLDVCWSNRDPHDQLIYRGFSSDDCNLLCVLISDEKTTRKWLSPPSGPRLQLTPTDRLSKHSTAGFSDKTSFSLWISDKSRSASTFPRYLFL